MRILLSHACWSPLALVIVWRPPTTPRPRYRVRSSAADRLHAITDRRAPRRRDRRRRVDRLADMDSRRVGRSGLEVSRLGLGTMTWGRDTDADAAAAQLEAFVGAGGTLIDTANIYGDGDAESILGTLVPDVVSRSSVVLSTTTVGVGGGRGPLARGVGRVAGPAGHRPRRPVAGARVRRRGAVRGDLLGAADRRRLRPRPLRRGVRRHRLAVGHPGRLAAGAASPAPRWCRCESEYSLLERGPEESVLPAAAAHGLGFLAWAPLGRGVLTGKYRHGTPADSRGASPHFTRYVGRYRTDAGGADRRGGGHGRRRARHVAAGGGLRLGAGPAGGRQRGDRRPGPGAAARARWPPRRSCCPPRSAAPWTTSAPDPAAGRHDRPASTGARRSAPAQVGSGRA